MTLARAAVSGIANIGCAAAGTVDPARLVGLAFFAGPVAAARGRKLDIAARPVDAPDMAAHAAGLRTVEFSRARPARHAVARLTVRAPRRCYQEDRHQQSRYGPGPRQRALHRNPDGSPTPALPHGRDRTTALRCDARQRGRSGSPPAPNRAHQSQAQQSAPNHEIQRPGLRLRLGVTHVQGNVAAALRIVSSSGRIVRELHFWGWVAVLVRLRRWCAAIAG